MKKKNDPTERERVTSTREKLEAARQKRRESASLLQMLIDDQRELLHELRYLIYERNWLIQKFNHLIDEISMPKRSGLENDLESLKHNLEVINTKMNDLYKMVSVLHKKKKQALKILGEQFIMEIKIVDKFNLNSNDT